MDLFENALEHSIQEGAPLADRMRPRTLDEFVGQNHLLAPGRLLRRAIQADQLSSLIFFGPPGTGKTTLARIIANTTRSHFLSMQYWQAFLQFENALKVHDGSSPNSKDGPFYLSMKFIVSTKPNRMHCCLM